MEETVIQINGGIMINVDTSKKSHVYEKDYVWNPATCNCENGKCLESIRDVQWLHVMNYRIIQ